MQNMTILEAAEHLGVSKEAIHNRIRRGSLDVVVLDGVKYVSIDADVKVATPAKTTRAKSSSKASDDRYYKFLENQNSQLQEKVERLEGETRTLRDQKEEMLIREREKIEQIYKEKDEQLKSFLNTLSAQFMLHAPQQHQQAHQKQHEDHLDAEIEELNEAFDDKKGKLVSLKKYLKKEGYSSKQRDKIKEEFASRAEFDERIIVVGNKYYLDTVKFDYSDLITKG
jgi:DNA-binding Lrp family transcriptional regulator